MHRRDGFRAAFAFGSGSGVVGETVVALQPEVFRSFQHVCVRSCSLFQQGSTECLSHCFTETKSAWGVPQDVPFGAAALWASKSHRDANSSIEVKPTLRSLSYAMNNMVLALSNSCSPQLIEFETGKGNMGFVRRLASFFLSSLRRMEATVEGEQVPTEKGLFVLRELFADAKWFLSEGWAAPGGIGLHPKEAALVLNRPCTFTSFPQVTHSPTGTAFTPKGGSVSPVASRDGHLPREDDALRMPHPESEHESHTKRIRSQFARWRWKLRNGVEMPVVGLGTWQLNPDVAGDMLALAIDAGVRHLDTAQSYGNEAAIGERLQTLRYMVRREDMWLSTKLSNSEDFNPDRLHVAFAEQLARLRTSYVDCYIMHKPVYPFERTLNAWKILEDFYEEGRVRSLGVSNFGVQDLARLLQSSRIAPHYIQAKFSIYQPAMWGDSDSGSLREFAARNQIQMVAYSIFRRSPEVDLDPLGDPHVIAIAQLLGRSPAQVLLRWCIQNGVAVIPRSGRVEGIRENFDLNFEIPESQMLALNGIPALLHGHVGSSPGHSWYADVYAIAGVSSASSDFAHDSQKAPLLEPKFFEAPPAIEAILREDWPALDPNIVEPLAFLRSLPGAHEFPHSHKPLFDHLRGTWSILKAWGQPEYVTLAGLFHNVYSASGNFRGILLNATEGPSGGRELLKSVIGTQAEALVYKFMAVDWVYITNVIIYLLAKGLFPKGTANMVSREPLEWTYGKPKEVGLTLQDVADILIISVADNMDQMYDGPTPLEVVWPAAVLEDRLWPGAGKPATMMSSFAAWAKLAVGTGMVRVVPPIFNRCTANFVASHERMARDVYWAVITSDVAEFSWSQRVAMLEAVAAWNPYIGEPRVLLGQLFLRNFSFARATSFLREALQIFYAWGTQWDKRWSFRQWVAWSRLLLRRVDLAQTQQDPAGRILEKFAVVDIPRVVSR